MKNVPATSSANIESRRDPPRIEADAWEAMG